MAIPRNNQPAGPVPSSGNNEPVSTSEDAPPVIQAVNAMYEESRMARHSRMEQNRRNRDVFLGRQDWSYKQEGQSTEFLPKVPTSVEQMSSFVKKSLVQFGSWFSVQVDDSLDPFITEESVRAILQCFLSNLWKQNEETGTVATTISDSVKNGLLESMMILKVHGGMHPTRRFVAEPGRLQTDPETGRVSRTDQELKTEETEEWRLRIDLIPPEDYYPDPSGRGLYEIHDCERDLHEVMLLADEGVYDKSVVEQLRFQDYQRPEDQKRTDRDRAQDETVAPGFRKRVRLREFWGTLLNNDGTVAQRNVVCTVANERFLIRPPEPNPFWHQESPFVTAPLIRVPWSVWHKALYDDASALNLAINEMFNLMLDGGIASVWGIKQVRLDDLEDPSQVSGGISQGQTLAVKGTLPHGASVAETISEGQVPQDAMAMFQFLNTEYNQAALTNELRQGSFPEKQVRATEVVEASQGQALTLEGIVSDLEYGFIPELLRKSWLTILQNADELPQDIIRNHADARTALILMRASPAERFAMFAGRCKFKVSGLSETMNRMRDFQKIMALLQVVTQNPLMLQSFVKRYSPDKALQTIIKTLQIDPEDLELSKDETEALQQRIQEMFQFAQMLQPQRGGSGAGEQGGMGTGAGQPGLNAEVNQNMFPATGQPPNA